MGRRKELLLLLDEHYSKTAPEVVIEIDVQAYVEEGRVRWLHTCPDADAAADFPLEALAKDPWPRAEIQPAGVFAQP